jgi:large subunit ribosomal protein L29
MIKAEEIRKMTKEEIETKVASLRKEHYTLRVQAKTGKLEKQHRIKALKRDIARLMTIQKEMAQSA